MTILIQMESYGTMQMDFKWYTKSFGKEKSSFKKTKKVLQVIFTQSKVQLPLETRTQKNK